MMVKCSGLGARSAELKSQLCHFLDNLLSYSVCLLTSRVVIIMILHESIRIK